MFEFIKISYHDFGWFGPITNLFGIIVCLFIISYVNKEYKRTQRFALSDLIGIICWTILAWCPGVNVGIGIVLLINGFFDKLITGLFKADSIILFKGDKK